MAAKKKAGSPVLKRLYKDMGNLKGRFFAVMIPTLIALSQPFLLRSIGFRTP